MRQYTTPEQTAKLIELGFEKPNSEVECDLPKGDWRIGAVGLRKAYSIGELIEILPKEINNDILPDMLGFYIDHKKMWTVEYSNMVGAIFSTYRAEFVDALYDIVVKLKEEGVIC